jgi:hypothetical protein
MLDRFHKIAEIVASFAIVGSLIFVGIQVSQNTDATRISNSHAALDSWNEITLAMAADKELTQSNLDGVYPELREHMPSDVGEERIYVWLNAGIKAVEHNYLQWLDGNLSDELWRGYRMSMVDMFVYFRSVNDFWSDRKQTYSEPFQLLMDKLVVEGTEQRMQMIEQSHVDAAEQS